MGRIIVNKDVMKCQRAGGDEVIYVLKKSTFCANKQPFTKTERGRLINMFENDGYNWYTLIIDNGVCLVHRSGKSLFTWEEDLTTIVAFFPLEHRESFPMKLWMKIFDKGGYYQCFIDLPKKSEDK